MSSRNEPADPIPDGILATAKQSWGDLFRWRQRVVITNEQGETYAEWQDPEPFKNPISLFMMLSARDWLFFLVGLAAWTADAFDFHALSIQQVKLAKYYGRSKTDISTAITLTLLLRSVGAAFFGLAGDRYGRKWPMVNNLNSDTIRRTRANSRLGDQHDRPWSSADCDHLQQYFPAVPGCAKFVRSLYGWCVWQCYCHGP
jgi:hypothetical protein